MSTGLIGVPEPIFVVRASVGLDGHSMLTMSMWPAATSFVA
ncbi:hypothetical protein [Solwaraspora sp. WMMA2065]|nr:hypothetical protein [Solwaraspora sp. WMMA2065]WJK36348.1 hypothetical protein O7610_08355 [Solwaraspora sp. WMMA2065]